MRPDILLEFEERHPGNSPVKRERIRRDLGLSDIRYYQLLNHAASSLEGIAAHPFTARQVRDRAEHREHLRESRVGRAHILPTDASIRSGLKVVDGG